MSQRGSLCRWPRSCTNVELFLRRTWYHVPITTTHLQRYLTGTCEPEVNVCLFMELATHALSAVDCCIRRIIAGEACVVAIREHHTRLTIMPVGMRDRSSTPRSSMCCRLAEKMSSGMGVLCLTSAARHRRYGCLLGTLFSLPQWELTLPVRRQDGNVCVAFGTADVTCKGQMQSTLAGLQAYWNELLRHRKRRPDR